MTDKVKTVGCFFLLLDFKPRGLAKLMIIYLQLGTITIPDPKHTVPDRLGSAAHGILKILKIIESPLEILKFQDDL